MRSLAVRSAAHRRRHGCAQRRALRRALHLVNLRQALAGMRAVVYRIYARAPDALDSPKNIKLLGELATFGRADNLFLLAAVPGACARPTSHRPAHRSLLFLDAIGAADVHMARVLVAHGAGPDCPDVWEDLEQTSTDLAASYRLCVYLAASPGPGRKAFRGFPNLGATPVAREVFWRFLADGNIVAARFVAARAKIELDAAEEQHVRERGDPRGLGEHWRPCCNDCSGRQLARNYVQALGPRSRPF